MKRSIIKAALLTATVFAVSAFSQEDTARVLLRVGAPNASSATVTVSSGACGQVTRSVAPRASGRDTIIVPLGDVSTSILHGERRQNAPVTVRQNRGSISLDLNAEQYGNAAVSLHSLNGRRVLRRNVSVSSGISNISAPNIAEGVYMLSVKGGGGSVFTSRVVHSGGGLNINVSFDGNRNFALGRRAAQDCGEWTIKITAEGYRDTTLAPRVLVSGVNDIGSVTLAAAPIIVEPGDDIYPPPTERANFTETIGTGANAVSFEMVYISGGTFTLGCESGSNCPDYTAPVSGVTVSGYFIGKTEVTQELWNLVMGGTPCTGFMCPPVTASHGNHTWYEAHEFACRLSALTGRNYRMLTEAEWEYAVKQPNRSGLERVTEGEEWTYNNWSGTHIGGDNPLGPGGPMHNQKTRRDGQGVNNPEVARFIRSIEGTGPHFRLGLSAETAYPPGMVPSCEIHAPAITGGAAGFSDTRLITADGERWEGGVMAGQSMSDSRLTIRADGGAAATGFLVGGGQYGMSNITGQWYTLNAYTLIIVPNSGPPEKYIYMMIDDDNMSLMKDGNMPWRFVRAKAAGPTAPAVSNWDPAALAAANTAVGRSHTINMNNPPTDGKDSRLILPATHTWVQDNICGQFGGIHRYRKHFDSNSMWFSVWEGGGAVGLARSSWYTIDNTFLRAYHTVGNNTLVFDYLYAVSADGNTLYHISYQGYERADFRMFDRTPVNPTGDCRWNSTGTGDPTGSGSMWPYENRADGVSTYVPPSD